MGSICPLSDDTVKTVGTALALPSEDYHLSGTGCHPFDLVLTLSVVNTGATWLRCEVEAMIILVFLIFKNFYL